MAGQASDYAPGVAHDRDAALNQALIEETCRKSALVWLRPLTASRAVAAWHVFVAGAVHVVGGGIEQPLPPLADGEEVEVTARSKDTWGRLLTFRAVATQVRPDDEAWSRVVPELHAKRLNPPDGEAQPQRWARESTVLRLEPTGRIVESPGHLSARSHAAEPAGSPATTRGPLPFVVGRRARRRR
jgi:hypothetical protein